MNDFITVKQIDQVTKLIRSKIKTNPKVGLILGSGLGSAAEAIQQATVISTSLLPGWPISTVAGHEGKLVFGKLEDQDILVMQGRAHFYEGYSMPQIGFPIRVMQKLGISILIITNAAGAVNPKFSPGDLMLITDHLNLIGMSGFSPLRGPNLDTFGPRFPDMSQAYDRNLATIARNVAKSQKIQLQEGVYICLAGPSFETPADLRFLRTMGADAVGMSTVPEVTVAVHGGIRVLGFSGISNKANLDGNTVTLHEEVLAAGQIITPKLEALIRGVLRQLE